MVDMNKKNMNILLILLIFFILGVGCSTNPNKIEEPPDMIVAINGKKLEVAKGTYQWESKGLFENTVTIADAAAPFQIAAEMNAETIQQGSIANVTFSDDSKPEIDAYLWEGENRSEELPIEHDNFNFPSQTGTYVIEILAEWSNGDASYTLVVEVQ